MEKAALKDLLYGGLIELMNNKEFYRRSGVSPEYSHWTEKGAPIMIAYVDSISKQMDSAEQQDLDRRAKDLVIKGLKGEKV